MDLLIFQPERMFTIWLNNILTICLQYALNESQTIYAYKRYVYEKESVYNF